MPQSEQNTLGNYLLATGVTWQTLGEEQGVLLCQWRIIAKNNLFQFFLIFIIICPRKKNVGKEKTRYKILLHMDDKTYNRISAILLLTLGVGGILVSLTYAIPAHGFAGLIALLISICSIILGLDKDTWKTSPLVDKFFRGIFLYEYWQSIQQVQGE